MLPPLIWGWLTYRVMVYDMLADHASAERRTLPARHARCSASACSLATWRGAEPDVGRRACCSSRDGALLPAAIWIYTLVFAFSALWFGHYLLAALEALREERPRGCTTAPAPVEQPPPCSVPMPELRPRHHRRRDPVGKRQDKHLPKVIELLAAPVGSVVARYVGDDEPQRITADPRHRLPAATPCFVRRHWRDARRPHPPVRRRRVSACRLALHPEARELILQRIRAMAAEQGTPSDPDREDTLRRLEMGVFPQGAQIIPEPVQQDSRFFGRRRISFPASR